MEPTKETKQEELVEFLTPHEEDRLRLLADDAIAIPRSFNKSLRRIFWECQQILGGKISKANAVKKSRYYGSFADFCEQLNESLGEHGLSYSLSRAYEFAQAHGQELLIQELNLDLPEVEFTTDQLLLLSRQLNSSAEGYKDYLKECIEEAWSLCGENQLKFTSACLREAIENFERRHPGCTKSRAKKESEPKARTPKMTAEEIREIEAILQEQRSQISSLKEEKIALEEECVTLRQKVSQLEKLLKLQASPRDIPVAEQLTVETDFSAAEVEPEDGEVNEADFKDDDNLVEIGTGNEDTDFGNDIEPVETAEVALAVPLQTQKLIDKDFISQGINVAITVNQQYREYEISVDGQFLVTVDGAYLDNTNHANLVLELYKLLPPVVTDAINTAHKQGFPVRCERYFSSNAGSTFKTWLPGAAEDDYEVHLDSTGKQVSTFINKSAQHYAVNSRNSANLVTSLGSTNG